EYAEQALHMARAAALSEPESECLRVLGTLHARGGDTQAAEARFHESIAACRQRNDAYREGLALLELGQLYEQMLALCGSE
ncbi:hypothetical protein, partial [Salmonella sp. SAL4431]|uniref:hypothetical protein n=1 Tax=Salmonella sp. SAL4431 TaxID=3159886 RepID=UPI00397812E6